LDKEMMLASRKITIEEALTTDEFEHFDDAFLPSIKKRYGDYLKARLHVDLYETRLEDMDNGELMSRSFRSRRRVFRASRIPRPQ
jgi:hypothetical protein